MRWFFRGSLPEDVGNWFASGTLCAEEAERTDEYLLLPSCETTSVKLREGRFEIKALTQSPTELSVNNALSGQCASWVKWSQEATDLTSFRDMITDPADTWVFISKRRLLRIFSLDSGNPTEVDASNVITDDGCQVEITSIRAIVANSQETLSATDWDNAARWWSYSLESFSPNSSDVIATNRNNLKKVAALLASEVPFRLALSDSRAYPAWLLELARPD